MYKMGEIPEYKWTKVENSEIPANSYICGYSAEGFLVHVGLVNYRGVKYPARIIPAKMEAVISYGGVDKKLNNWHEVLVLK